MIGLDINALGLITAERLMRLNRIGYTNECDDQYTEGELAMAAMAYACPLSIDTEPDTSESVVVIGQDGEVEPIYPFADRPHLLFCGDRRSLPVQTRVEQLVMAGALIAAEIDRLRRRHEQ